KRNPNLRLAIVAPCARGHRLYGRVPPLPTVATNGRGRPSPYKRCHLYPQPPLVCTAATAIAGGRPAVCSCCLHAVAAGSTQPLPLCSSTAHGVVMPSDATQSLPTME
ncbi:hypothetical protein BHM03_00048817, partial [Ensete ventricosum]